MVSMDLICPECGTYFKRNLVSIRVRGNVSCSKCVRESTKKKQSLEERIKVIEKIDKLGYILDDKDFEYLNNQTKIKFICSDCGVKFERRVCHLDQTHPVCTRCGYKISGECFLNSIILS